MKMEEVEQLLATTERDYTQKQHVLRGLVILAKYNDNLLPDFEHDQMWAGNAEKMVEHMSREDVVELAVCGWFLDEGSWSHF